jgi:hypothetical protein
VKLSKSAYQGQVFSIEFFVAEDGLCFFFIGKRVILTHGFLKKSDKTPKGEIDQAEKIKSNFTSRYKK